MPKQRRFSERKVLALELLVAACSTPNQAAQGADTAGAGATSSSASGTGAMGGASAAGGSSAGMGNAGEQATTTSGVGGATMGGAAGAAAGEAGTGAMGGAAGAGATGGQAGGCTVSEFQDWPTGTSPQEIGDLLVTDYLSRERGAYHYSDACAWYGALGFTKIVGDTTRNQQLIDDFDQFLGDTSYYPPGGTTVDDRVGGIVPLELSLQTRDTATYLGIGLAPADAQYGELTANPNSARFWADDMFMITGLQVQAWRASGYAKYRELAVTMLLLYRDALQQDNGLFWHTRYSQIHWCRANGWVASGMAELLRDLPAGDARDQVMSIYQDQMAGLASFQIPAQEEGGGLWRQIIDYEPAWFETSCSAMFTFSIATGVRNGWLDAATYAPIARRGWLAVVGQIGPDGKLANICEGTGSPSVPASDVQGQRDYYLGRQRGTGDLHGQAPVMWAASTFLRDYACPVP